MPRKKKTDNYREGIICEGCQEVYYVEVDLPKEPKERKEYNSKCPNCKRNNQVVYQNG